MPLKRSPRPVPAGRLPPLSRPGQRTPERSPRRVVPTDADAGDDRRDSGDTAMKRDVSPEKIRLALEATRASWVIKPSAPKDASPEKEEAPAPAPRSTRPKRGRAAREESEAPAPAAAEEEGGDDDEEEEEEEEEEAPRRRPTRRAASAAKQRTADMMDTS